MKELKTEIEINAKATDVWKVLNDFEQWPTWNPIVNKVIGKAGISETLTITMCGKEGKDAQKYNATFIEYTENTSFRWRAKMIATFLFTNDKVITIKETENGCVVTHIEAFSGLLVPLFWGKLESGVIPMMTEMNNALKTNVETN